MNRFTPSPHSSSPGPQAHEQDQSLARSELFSQQTFCRWKKKHGGMGPGEMRRLKQLEDASRKLKRLTADHSLDKAMRGEEMRPADPDRDRSGFICFCAGKADKKIRPRNGAGRKRVRVLSS